MTKYLGNMQIQLPVAKSGLPKLKLAIVDLYSSWRDWTDEDNRFFSSFLVQQFNYLACH